MKLGELKIETLMLIFPSISIDVDTENDEELINTLNNLKSDSNFCDYLSAMTGAINRCFTNLEGKGVLPLFAAAFSHEAFEERGGMLCLDISDKKNGKVDKVSFRNTYANSDSINFSFEGDNILLIEDFGEGVYTVTFERSIPRIKNTTGADYLVDLPDSITVLMPYFIKSEIMRTDDNEEASVARSLYEAGISEIVNSSNRYGYQSKVETILKV